MSERSSRRRDASATALRAAQHVWVAGAALSNAAAMWRPLWQHRGSHVVVLDRFVLDAEVKLLYWYAVRRKLDVEVQRRLFRAASPPTDVPVLLLVDPTTNHARRADQYDLEAFHRFHDLYREVSKRYGAHPVDSEQSAPEVTRDLADVVWRHLP